MSVFLYSVLLVSCVSIQPNAFSQSILLDSLQIERVAKTCQLWGHIKYFHPYLSHSSLDWESAFSNSIDGVIQATSSKEYGQAVQKMLDQLHDPATRVAMHQEELATEDTSKYPVIRFIQDSILLIAVNDYRDLEDDLYVMSKIKSLHTLIPKAKGIVFDFRSTQDIIEFRGDLSWYFKRIESDLTSEELPLPGLQARFHDGFVPELGGTSGGYTSGFYTKEQKSISPGAKKPGKPIVFIVNRYAEIPLSALALQNAGKAHILSEDMLTDASFADLYPFKLDDSVTVAIRLSALSPGTPVKADAIIPANTNEASILQMAMQLLQGQVINETPKPLTDTSTTTLALSKPEKFKMLYPDLGNRLLASAKIWTVIHYFFAYQDLMKDDWDKVLVKYIPRFASAIDSLEYHLAVAEMYTHIQDGHGSISSKVLGNYFGTVSPPISIRFIEDRPVVTEIFPDSIYKVRGIELGDIILAVDGEKSADRVKRMSQYISSSNPSALLYYISWRFLNGKDSSEVDVQIQKQNGKVENVTLPRLMSFNQYGETLGNDRNQTPITRLIDNNIGYADLDRLMPDMVDKMFEDFKDTKAIIFDMRGYPHGTAWTIAPHLIDKANVYASNIRRYSPMSIQEGASKHMTFFEQALAPPQLPTYRGKTVMLIDERTQSQSEHTGLFFEAANGTKFIGSQSAGANGDVTNFKVPGNIVLYFSGNDVRHIDGRQLQQVGLVPDVLVKPSIKGIRENKDEVLEKAINYVESQIKN